MPDYDDPEKLIAAWLHEQLGKKTWADPRLPDSWPFTSPIGHVQRGAGEGDTVLALDTVLLDVDWYAKNADHAREVADQTRALLRLSLPGHQFPSGVLCTSVQTVTAPFWAPEPVVYRRSATYRVFLAGVVT